jgi:Zn-dependent protease with chaperone function
MKLRLLAAALLAAVLVAPARAEPSLYLVDALAEQADHAPVRAQAQELAAIYHDLARVSGVEATLVYSDDPDLNAFATEVGGEKLVVVQEGLLQRFGGDRDAVAAALGHELAHHKGDHVRAGRRKQEGVRVFGAILGAVVGAKVGRNSGALAGAASHVAVNAGAHLLALKFNRNQELQADRWAVQWMLEAGYNPAGMLRLQDSLGALAGPQRRAAMLSTHPTSRKRTQAAQRAIDALAPAPELLGRASAPLVAADDLAQAQAAIAAAEQARVAQALAPAASEAPPAAALEPIDGVALADYAALGNALLQSGARGQPAVLAERRLDETRLAALNSGYAARMQQHPALAQRYTVEFYRASRGRLAAWGRDVADSMEHGRPLQLEPPVSLSDAHALHAALQARGAPAFDEAARAAAETELLAAHGLSYYDWLIVHHWWSRKATIAALSGDISLVQAYYGSGGDDAAATREPAAASGVTLGENVTIGANVRVGGKPVSTAPAGE